MGTNTTMMCHCHLCHIGKKSMKSFIIIYCWSFDSESFDACKTFQIGKMTKTLFVGYVKLASDLLGIIHSYLCDLMSISAWWISVLFDFY
jgi:hypothetical protein